MKWWQWMTVAIGFVLTVMLELVSWSLPSVAFTFLPSALYCGIVATTVRWPTSVGIALALGGTIDLFAPAPFGVWLVALATLVVVTEWIKTTWLKQPSVLSICVASCLSLIVSTIPFWLWLMISWQSTVVSPAIQIVSWWQWPVSWLLLSVLIAAVARLLPSPYERLL